MKIVINLNKEEMNHIRGEHTFYDCCEQVEHIMRKVQKQVDKVLSKQEKK